MKTLPISTSRLTRGFLTDVFCYPFRARRLSIALIAAALATPSLLAADWACGFEASEGFVNQKPATGSVVTVMGGTAIVQEGAAAEGRQFIRFTPQQAENALFIKLGGGSGAMAQNRRIDFAARLIGDAEKTRLVLSHGQTLALHPTEGGIDLEVSGMAPRRLALSATSAGWVTIGVEESAEKQTWNLYVGGVLAAHDLPLESNSELFSDLLVFADGVLDVDAIHVTVTDEAAAGASQAVAAGAAPLGKNTADGVGQAGPSFDPLTRRTDMVAKSLKSARAGDLASVESIAAIASTEFPYTAAWHLDVAGMLSTVAFDLHDDGYYASSIALGRAVLQHLQRADQKFSGTEAKVIPAASAFLAALINDHLLNDAAEAQRQYQRVLTLDASHAGAKEALDRMARKPGMPAGKNSTATHGG